MDNYDDTAPCCGITDSVHAKDCREQRHKLREGGPIRSVAPIRQVGDDCMPCEGPCRYGQCPDCRGHSEHNVGCPQVPATTRRK